MPSEGGSTQKELNDHTTNQDYDQQMQSEKRKNDSYESNLSVSTLFKLMATTPKPKYQHLPHTMSPIPCVVSTCWQHLTVNRHHHFNININRGYSLGQSAAFLKMFSIIFFRFLMISLQKAGKFSI